MNRVAGLREGPASQGFRPDRPPTSAPSLAISHDYSHYVSARGHDLLTGVVHLPDASAYYGGLHSKVVIN